jgi:hypothetical protein
MYKTFESSEYVVVENQGLCPPSLKFKHSLIVASLSIFSTDDPGRLHLRLTTDTNTKCKQDHKRNHVSRTVM